MLVENNSPERWQTVPQSSISEERIRCENALINDENTSINNLKGIEYFTNLKLLSCSRNNLTTLDVSGLTTLKELRCEDNNLTTLNVNGLTALSFLSCSRNNLTTLDVSGHLELENLYCYGNPLTLLNVTDCPKLTSLYYDSGTKVVQHWLKCTLCQGQIKKKG